MFTSIPLAYYTTFYYIVLFLITILYFIYTQNSAFDSRYKFNIICFSVLGYITLLFTISYMGTRPVSGRYFGDMSTYYATFELMKVWGRSVMPPNDKLFYYYMYICTRLMSSDKFFLLTAFLYIIPLFITSRKLFKKYWFYYFLLLISSFSFWSYGTNGIRNGLATSIFLLVFSTKNVFLRIAILALSAGIHSSMFIPLAAYIVALMVKKTSVLFMGWLLATPVSLIAGGFFQNLFASLIEDDRTSYLTQGNVNDDTFSSTGFRWDFVIYSAVPVFIGYYFIIRNQYKDRLYEIIYGTYLVANAFWILVIKANFSNRFSYLSWFMMALVIVYPFIMNDRTKKSHQILGDISLVYFLFTFIMSLKS